MPLDGPQARTRGLFEVRSKRSNRVTAATVKRLDPTQVELEIPIDPSELANEQERAFRELSKNVRMPGFRPGKVPRKLFEAQYGSAQIQERAMEAVVGKAYPKALEENDLDPVDAPQMELLPVEEGQPVRVRATVAVRPQIELGTYKGIELEGPSAAVSDTDVENALTALVQSAAEVRELTREAASLLRAADAAEEAYRGCAVSLIDVLDSDRQMLIAQDNLARVRADTARAAVSSYRALGGGW